MDDLNFTLLDILPTKEEVNAFAEMWQQGYEFKLEQLVKPEHEEILNEFEKSCDDVGVDSMDLFQSLLKSRLFFEAISKLNSHEGLKNE